MQKMQIRKYVAVNEAGHVVGEDHPRAVLTDHDVDLLLELRAEGMSYRWLALKFEISHKHCWRIVKGVARGQIPTGHRRVR